MAPNRWNFPDLGLGIGLRTVHFGYIINNWPKIDFFEIVSENFMDTHGRPMKILDQIAERYPILMHGVSMSIGSTDPLDMEYLKQLKALADRVKAPWVSDHLCWTGVLGRNVHDLLPMPLTEASLKYVTRRVQTVQEVLERPLILENPSSYLEYNSSQMPEWEYLARLCEAADCGLLVDVNNVYVSSFNHGWDANEYIDSLPVERIAYHHLSGHTHKGTHILDTHDDYVVDGVWELYGRMHQRTGGRSTLVEWDANIPDFDTVHAEVLKARAWRDALPRQEVAIHVG